MDGIKCRLRHNNCTDFCYNNLYLPDNSYLPKIILFMFTNFPTLELGGAMDLVDVMTKHFYCFIVLLVVLLLHTPVLIFFLCSLRKKFCSKNEENRTGCNGTVIKCSRNVINIQKYI